MTTLLPRGTAETARSPQLDEYPRFPLPPPCFCLLSTRTKINIWRSHFPHELELVWRPYHTATFACPVGVPGSGAAGSRHRLQPLPSSGGASSKSSIWMGDRRIRGRRCPVGNVSAAIGDAPIAVEATRPVAGETPVRPVPAAADPHSLAARRRPDRLAAVFDPRPLRRLFAPGPGSSGRSSRLCLPGPPGHPARQAARPRYALRPPLQPRAV